MSDDAHAAGPDETHPSTPTPPCAAPGDEASTEAPGHPAPALAAARGYQQPAFAAAPGYRTAAYPPPPPGYGPGPRPGYGRPPTTALGPVATLPPRPPGPVTSAVAEFWRAGHGLPASALAVCAGVGVLGGVLLVGHRPGLGAALVGLGVWLAAVPALVRRRDVGDLLTAGLSVALLSMVAVRDAGWIVAVCAAAAAVLAAVALTGARSAGAVLGSVVGWCAGLLRALPWVGRSLRAGARRGRFAALARTGAVTAVLLVVFGVLFSSADLVFASYVPDVHVDLLPAQVAAGIGVALAAATFAHLAAAPPGWSDLRAGHGRPAALAEWAVPVVALDAMVLAFVLVQVGGLLGGHRHILEAADLSYAEYARQGFGQLVAATALTLLVVGVAARHAPRTTPRERLVVRLALGVLCVGTLGVVASAVRRMDLYVEAFGLTRLRLFVVVVEVALGVVLLLVLAAGVRWRGAWLPRAIAHVAGVAVLGLALANPDAVILRHNTTVLATVLAGAAEASEASDASDVADLDYLRGLSADAVPAAAALEEPLRSCVLATMEVVAPEGFADWNLGRVRAADVLAGEPVDPTGVDCAPSSTGG